MNKTKLKGSFDYLTRVKKNPYRDIEGMPQVVIWTLVGHILSKIQGVIWTLLLEVYQGGHVFQAALISHSERVRRAMHLVHWPFHLPWFHKAPPVLERGKLPIDFDKNEVPG